MKKIVFGFTVACLLGFWIVANLGKWLDTTQKPVESNIVVCLGGGTIERVKQSIALIEQGYVSQNRLLLLGESWYNQPYIRKHYPDVDTVIDEVPTNTIEEIKALRKYMAKQGYRQALIVTDPPHSLRVTLLNALIGIQGDDHLTLHLVGSGVSWWDRGAYYQNSVARNAVKWEIIKLPYNFILYKWESHWGNSQDKRQ